ncbi:DNA repair protein MmcB-related protein [Alsobacter soli]|uniref:DNA repair protein MmcB-related protein n=1 Tax=Alsobacter soli TaxID=2109933 RepID=A0A2T1HQY5_9HYPH|nr:MmcB family DNA repair protein [Alsobacter soli]PSC04056.1 DNA repair protein MmcB-related protein [Alsobacter soli]
MPFAAVVSPPVDGRQSETALAVARGTRRLLTGLGFASVTELPLASGRRADIVALGQDGSVWIVEIKSSVEDFRTDRKWPDYRAHCDRLYFAIPGHVPAEIMPPDAGLIVADAYGAAVLRDPGEHRMPAATRKALLLRFAHASAGRLHALFDPEAASGSF